MHPSPSAPIATTRPVRRASGVVLALAAVVVLASCLTANQTRMVDHINTSRGDVGKPSVSANQATSDKAQAWAEHMSRTGVVEHTGGGRRVDTSGIPKWCSVGENVGRAADIESLHAAFMRSASHKATILGNYNRVGTGVQRKGNQVYGVQIFYRAC